MNYHYMNLIIKVPSTNYNEITIKIRDLYFTKMSGGEKYRTAAFYGAFFRK